LAQDPIAGRNAGLRPSAARSSLSDAWNATFIGRYVKSHHISRTALVGAALGVAVLFFVVGAGLRLLVGPISLGPLSGQISDALAQALPGITIKYDQAAVEWSRSQGRVNLVVLGARVFDSKGRIIAQAPQADIDLAAQPFIQGKVVVTRVTLVGVQLTLVRDRTGTLRLGVERDESQADIIRRITDAINKNSSSASSLQSFAIRDARLAFMDETTGLFLVAPRADVRIADEGPNLVSAVDADIEISGKSAHVVGRMILPPKDGPVSGQIQVSHLDIAALGRNAQMFHFLRSIAMVADFSAAFVVDGTHLLNAQFAASSQGTAVLVGIRKPIHVATLHVAGRYDRAAARLTLDDATLDSDQLRTHLVGKTDLFYDRAGAIGRVGVDLTADKTALAVPGTFIQPVFLPLVQLKGSYLPATHDILLDYLKTSGGAMVLATSGRITLIDKQSPVVELKGRIETMSVRDLLHYWPLGTGEGARDWIDRNIFSGGLGPIVYETHFPAGMFDLPRVPDGAMLMTFGLLNVEASYVHGLTHLTKVFGNAKLTGNTFSADLTGGRIGPLVLTRAHAVIADLATPGSPGDITGHIDGSMTDILKLTDLQPLNYPTRFGIDPNQTAGKAGLDLSVHVPMRRNLSVDDVGISIKATVSGFGIALGKATRLNDGNVVFEIDNTHLHASGAVGLATSRLTLDWVEDFKGAGPVTSRINVKGLLDEPGREALGLHMADYLKGQIGIAADLTGRRGQLTGADMALDLTPAALSLDLVGIDKPAGFPASAHATATFGPHSVPHTENMTITGPSLQATLAMTFNDDGTLVALNAPSVKSGTTNDFAFNFARGPSGVDITVRGHSIDGTKLAARGSGKPGAAPGGGAGGKPAAGHSGDSVFDGPFHIDARLDRVALRNGVGIAPFALDVTGVAERPGTLTLSGSTGRGGVLTGSIAPAGGDRKLTLTAADVGTLARGLFGFNSLKGGRLEFQGTLHGSAAAGGNGGAANDYEGVFKLKDFRVLNQPFLARLFSAGSLIGFGNLLQNNGIAVDELKVPFSAANGVIAIHDARATGPAIGISAEGYLDRPKNELELKGTLVPLFGINSVLGIIPLLGDLLISKPGEGIIGLSYTVSGNADEPKVSINPLSIVTPGILRRVFEGKMPNAANAPSNAPPTAVVVTPQNAPPPTH
jgi:hypothetical protein